MWWWAVSGIAKHRTGTGSKSSSAYNGSSASFAGAYSNTSVTVSNSGIASHHRADTLVVAHTCTMEIRTRSRQLP